MKREDRVIILGIFRGGAGGERLTKIASFCQFMELVRR